MYLLCLVFLGMLSVVAFHGYLMDLDISKLQSLINAKRDKFLMEKIESADNDLAEEEAFIEYREQLILMQEAVLKQAEDNL